MMTTKEQAHCFVAARRAGVNACLVKPFMPAALRRTIEGVWPLGPAPLGQTHEATAVQL